MDKYKNASIAVTTLKPPTICLHGNKTRSLFSNRNNRYHALNFPLWQLIRCIVPAICVGNTVLIKPALNAIETTITLTKLCPEPAIFDATYLTDERTASLIQHVKIGGVIYRKCPGRKSWLTKYQNLKPCVLNWWVRPIYSF